MFFNIGANLKVGEVSDPIESDRGVYIVKLLEEPVVNTIPLEEVKDKVAYQYKYEKKLEEMKRLQTLANVRAEKDIKKFTSN